MAEPSLSASPRGPRDAAPRGPVRAASARLIAHASSARLTSRAATTLLTLLAAAAVLAAAACTGSPVAPKPGETWGGAGIRLSVGADSSTLELDCAHGAINAPFTLQAAGVFDLPGHYVFEHGGPVPAGQPPDDHPARYTGHVSGGRMTLSIALTDTTRSVGNFTLKRGTPGVVLKCL